MLTFNNYAVKRFESEGITGMLRYVTDIKDVLLATDRMEVRFVEQEDGLIIFSPGDIRSRLYTFIREDKYSFRMICVMYADDAPISPMVFSIWIKIDTNLPPDSVAKHVAILNSIHYWLDSHSSVAYRTYRLDT